MNHFSDYPAGVPELHRFVRRKIAGRIAGAISWLVFWIVSCTLWGRTSEYMSPFGWTLLGIGLGMLGWPLFGIGRLIADKPFEGTISSLRMAYVWHSDTPLSRNLRKEPVITAYVGLDDGQTVRFRFPVKDICPKDYYAVGDRVRHYRFLPYLEKQSKPEDVVVCVVCGKFSLIGDDVCEECRLPLLK